MDNLTYIEFVSQLIDEQTSKLKELESLLANLKANKKQVKPTTRTVWKLDLNAKLGSK